MMLYMHAFSFELISLAAGVALLLYARKQLKIKNFWPSFAAWVIIILSSLAIICAGFHSVRLWSKGYSHMQKMTMEKDLMMK